jgi:hypothetical protein
MDKLSYHSVLFKEFKESPQAACYDYVYQLELHDLSEKEIDKIVSESGNKKKCIFLGCLVEPLYYDHGAVLSKQFIMFLDLCKQRQLYNTDIFLTCFGDSFKKELDILNNNHAGWNFIPYTVNLPVIRTSQLSNGPSKKTIMCLDDIECNLLHMNVATRLHRELFSKFLIKEKLIDTNCVAINLKRSGGEAPTTRIPVKYNDEWDTNQKLKDLWSTVDLEQINDVRIDNNMYQSQYDFISKAGVYIVSETVFHYPHTFFTEKTISALSSNRPFILIGPCNSLTVLKQKGYKTFDNIFDESYDKITDPSARMEAIFDLVKDISRRPLSEIKQDVLTCQDRINHNNKLVNNARNYYNIFFRLCKEEAA